MEKSGCPLSRLKHLTWENVLNLSQCAAWYKMWDEGDWADCHLKQCRTVTQDASQTLRKGDSVGFGCLCSDGIRCI